MVLVKSTSSNRATIRRLVLLITRLSLSDATSSRLLGALPIERRSVRLVHSESPSLRPSESLVLQ